MPLEKTALIEFASHREIMQRQFIASKSNNGKGKGPKTYTIIPCRKQHYIAISIKWFAMIMDFDISPGEMTSIMRRIT